MRVKSMRQCPSCHELVPMGPITKYCSSACRQSAYRHRTKHQVERQACILCQVKQMGVSGRDRRRATWKPSPRLGIRKEHPRRLVSAKGKFAPANALDEGGFRAESRVSEVGGSLSRVT